MAIAVRIVRARTGREKVAFCGYHGWHDWYLAANLSSDEALDGHLLPGLSSNGVPRGLIGTALPFRFNCIAELEEIVSENEGDLAAIIMEPVRDHQPREGFLEGVRAIASDAGAVLVFDEITAGFRHTTGGSHLLYGVDPDVAVFAKGMSNGYAMAAVIGRSEIMDAAQSTFISSTYWTERLGPAAALATIKKHQRNAVGEHLDRIGRRVQRGWKEAADRAGLLIEVGGLPPISHFAIMHDHGQEARTLFTQLMLERGFLASRAFYATYAHQDSHVSDYLAAVEEVFCLLTRALDQGAVNSLLRGPVAHNGFHRLT
jgi:glutamate-1-semialdehyde 2,1-aminomutase